MGIKIKSKIKPPVDLLLLTFKFGSYGSLVGLEYLQADGIVTGNIDNN